MVDLIKGLSPGNPLSGDESLRIVQDENQVQVPYRELIASWIASRNGQLEIHEFVKGLEVNSSDFLVRFENNIYFPADGATPFVTGFTFNPAQWVIVQSTVLPRDLSAIGGSALIGYSLGASGSISRSVQSKLRDYASVQDFGAVDGGVVDCTISFQKAIDWVVSRAQASGRSYAVPAIVIPGGWYKITDTLNMKPWVHFVSDGPVYLDFTAIAPSKPGIVCNNTTTLPLDDARFAGNHSPFLDGARGTISIIGPGKATSTAAGIRVGNFIAGQRPFRDARMSNLVVTGWNAAQEWGNFDTYLCRTENCRFEQNNYGIMAANASNTNSGERMEWSGCTFAGSIACLMHNQPGFDANFYGCSFDFNDDVVKFGATSSFCTIRMDGCYVEALSGYIVDGSLLTGSDNTSQMGVMISDLITLARGRDSGKGVNSPSRPLFRGRFSLSLVSIKARYETRPYLEDSTLIAADVTVVAASGYHITPYQLPMRIEQVVNDDYDFQRNVEGTTADTLTSWTLGFNASVATRDIFTVSGKKVLRVVGTSGSTSSQITLRTKAKLEAKPGDVYFSNACLNAGSATGNILVLSRMEFYDGADALLATLPSFADYSFRTALNDTTVPNFSDGNSRWMDTHGYRAIAPKNTAYAKQVLYVGAFDGTLYISRSRVWRG